MMVICLSVCPPRTGVHCDHIRCTFTLIPKHVHLVVFPFHLEEMDVQTRRDILRTVKDRDYVTIES